MHRTSLEGTNRMEGHEVSIGDVYNLIRDTREDVIAMKERLQVVLDDSKDHNVRIKSLEETVSEVKYRASAIDNIHRDIADLTKKVYAFSGGAVVVGALVGTIINLVVQG